MDIKSAGEHVKDARTFHLPFGTHIELPTFRFEIPWFGDPLPVRFEVPWFTGPWQLEFGFPQFGGWRSVQFEVTKFMVLELAVAVLMILVFVPIAMRLRRAGAPRGKFTNAFEAILLYIRNEVARPTIGSHHADRFVPFLWTLFFFILFCNLFGAIPWAGTPTAALSVTGTLAGITLLTVTISGMREFGALGFWAGLVPPMEIPLPLAVFLKPMLLMIEFFGLLIRHSVLAVRLMANMFAGHLVLSVMLGFIAAVANTWLILWFGVTIASILGQIAINMLELLVAFIQAYIFTFLASLFIGMAVHEH